MDSKSKTFDGKVGLITGSARGLGKAFAIAILERGGKVCISDVNKDTLETTYGELKSQFGETNVTSCLCNVTSETQMQDLFQRTKSAFNQIDIVVNNAGIFNEDDWHMCLEVNLGGVIRGTLLGMEYLGTDKGGNGGTIVNIASVAGIVPVAFSPTYNASKHGVVGYTRSWAEHPEVAKNGIRLLCMCPNFVATEFLNSKGGGPYSCVSDEIAKKLITKAGIMSVDHVTEAFIKLLEDNDNNGGVMSVTMKDADYLSFPSLSSFI